MRNRGDSFYKRPPSLPSAGLLIFCSSPYTQTGGWLVTDCYFCRQCSWKRNILGVPWCGHWIWMTSVALSVAMALSPLSIYWMSFWYRQVSNEDQEGRVLSGRPDTGGSILLGVTPLMWHWGKAANFNVNQIWPLWSFFASSESEIIPDAGHFDKLNQLMVEKHTVS